MVTGQTIAKTVPHPLHGQLTTGLTDLLCRLEQVEALVSVASAALRHQNCEKDADVARVLQRDVGDRLSAEMDKVRALLRSVESAPKPWGKTQRRRN